MPVTENGSEGKESLVYKYGLIGGINVCDGKKCVHRYHDTTQQAVSSSAFQQQALGLMPACATLKVSPPEEVTHGITEAHPLCKCHSDLSACSASLWVLSGSARDLHGHFRTPTLAPCQ